MIDLVLAASLASPVARLNFEVNEFGLRGRGVMFVDDNDGRYARRFDVGPASDSEGYDGHVVWIADAASSTYIQNDEDTRNEVLRWSAILRAIEKGATPKNANIRIGNNIEHIAFFDYGKGEKTSRFPTHIRITDQQGTRDLHLVSVERLSSVSSSEFGPPPKPRDAFVNNSAGIASVPMLSEQIAGQSLPLVVVPVRINGTAMRFLLDTGGQNILSREAASHLHLHPEGTVQLGGAGSGTLGASYAWVGSVRLGEAEMRHQPFQITSLSLLPDIDGIVGAELLSRFAARFDFKNDRVLFARAAPSPWFSGKGGTIAFTGNMPSMNGTLDGFPGLFTLDTGSIGSLDVYTPFARMHDLYHRHQAAGNSHITGAGGIVDAVRIVVESLSLGTLKLERVHARLTLSRGGVTDDPTIVANIGEQIFQKFCLTLDYGTRRINFEVPR